MKWIWEKGPDGWVRRSPTDSSVQNPSKSPHAKKAPFRFGSRILKWMGRFLR